MSSQHDASPLGSRKRSHDGELVNYKSTPPNVVIYPASEHAVSTPARQSSPAPSILSSGSSLTELTHSVCASPIPGSSTASAQKKRKLTFAEREVEKTLKRQEKEEREREKAEVRVKREQEKREREEEKESARRIKELEKAQRDADKAKKDAEKAEKQKSKDVEKAKKDEEKAQREAEKLKKERAQMRLGAFFQKPAQASTPPSVPDDISSGVSSRRSSITSIDAELPETAIKSGRIIPSEFRKWFLPFFVEANMEVAPVSRFITSQHTLNLHKIDRLLESSQQSLELENPQVLKQDLKSSHKRARRGRRFIPIKTLVEQIEGNEGVTTSLRVADTSTTPLESLETVPMKVLSYSVDVRPPYQGTFTRYVSPRATRKLSRHPHSKLLPDINYDYDSEAEWEPPEDGDEDLNSEDDEGSVDNEDDEMDDFLDDADDVAKRRMIVGDVEPVSTGLCWQGSGLEVEASLKQYHVDVLDDVHLPFPIDPFSTKYWARPVRSSPVKTEKQSATIMTTMQPPRLPLATVSPNNTILNNQGGFATVPIVTLAILDGENTRLSASKQRNNASIARKPVKLVSPDLLPAFKQAVEGSDLTKAGLIEVLKKQFPKVAKDVIKDTLGAVAERKGAKEVDKRWVLS